MSAPRTDAIEKTSYTHDAVIDIIVANPEVSQTQLAAHFGYTQGWMSRMIRADSFQEALARRKNELVDPQLIASIEKRLEGLMSQALEILQEKLDAAPTFDMALKAAELGSRALGYGAKAPTQINASFVVHMPQKAQSSEEWLNTRVVSG